MSDDHILLQKGAARAIVNPSRGGACEGFWWQRDNRKLHWLRQATAQRAACFVMVPFASRIRHGQFSFAGRQVSLKANNSPEPHAIHGHGFQQPWEMLEGKEASLVIEYIHQADSWPWSYRVRQNIELIGNSLRLGVTVTNLSSHRMPLGVGFHPYFVSTPECSVHASVSSQWPLDNQLLPSTTVAAGRDDTGSVLFRGGDRSDAFYSGWDGSALLELPECRARIRVEASAPLHHLVVFADDAAEAVCIEPVSNVVDAFNLSTENVADDLHQVLQPGNEIAAEMLITPELY